MIRFYINVNFGNKKQAFHLFDRERGMLTREPAFFVSRNILYPTTNQRANDWGIFFFQIVQQ
jgi:hypothetical protein